MNIYLDIHILNYLKKFYLRQPNQFVKVRSIRTVRSDKALKIY